MTIVSPEPPRATPAPAPLRAAVCESCGEGILLVRQPLPGELCAGCEAEQE
jgi:hypothetical protein